MEATPGIHPRSKKTLETVAISLFLAAMVWIVFGQTLGHDFVNYDDEVYVFENTHVSAGLSVKGIGWAFTHTVGDNWHPLTTISHMLDCRVYGLHPWGHHLTNVLLHATTAILLFLALRQLTGATWRSAFVAAVFAIHPLRVESVAWVAERKDVLSGVFFMLTLLAYARYAQKPSYRGWYFAVIAFFATALMCKPTVVTLPFVLLLLDYWPLHRFPTESNAERRRLIVEKIPLFALSALSCMATMLAQKHELGLMGQLSFPKQIGNAVVSYAVYLWQMICPTGLAVLYPHPGNHLEVWGVISAVLLLAFVSIGVFVLRRKQPFLIVGWLWYLGVLVPMIGVVLAGAQAHADRYTYLPQIGLYLAATWCAADLCAELRYHRITSIAAGATIIAGLMWGAWIQTTYWQNSETLWNRTLAVTDDNALAYNNLGNALRQQGRFEEAVTQFQKALRILPGNSLIHADLGNALFQQGDLDDAIAQYQIVLQIDPEFAAVHNNLGNVLRQKGLPDEAIAHYQKALAIDPGFAKANENLGLALVQKQRLDEAIVQFYTALKKEPESAETYSDLSHALMLQGHLDEAIAELQKSIEIDSSNATTQYNLGIALAQKGRFKEAILAYAKAIAIQPGYIQAQNNMAWILATNPDEALRNGTKAVELAQQAEKLSQGKDASVLDTLAAAYAEAGGFPVAVATAQRTIALADSEGNAALAADARREMMLYQSGKPFRDTGK